MTDHNLPPGHAIGDEWAELEPLLAEDHSIWIFRDGYYRSDEHPDVACKDAASVAFHVSGADGTTKQYHGTERD